MFSGCAAVFEPGDPARRGQLAFWRGDGDQVTPEMVHPAGTLGEIVVAVPAGEAIEVRTVPAVRVPVAALLSALAAYDDNGSAGHPSVLYWRAATRLALQLAARGRLLPGLSPGGFDAWRLSPLDRADSERLHQVAAAMPATARATPIEGRPEPELADAATLVRAFLNTIADILPRPAAASTDDLPFAGPTPHHIPELAGWAAEVSAGIDAGVRISLRLEGGDGPTDFAPEFPADSFRAVIQVHSLADPTLVTDAARLWSGEPVTGFDAQARTDTMVAVRRAARLWSPLDNLLHQPVPDGVDLLDADIRDLLATGTPLLATVGVEVHWPKELVRTLSATAVVGSADSPTSDRPSIMDGGLLDFQWQLAIGDDPLTPAELEQLVAAHRPVVRLRDQWMLLDPALVRKAAQRQLKPLTTIEALGVALAGTAEVEGERVQVSAAGWLADLRRRITAAADEEPVAVPAALTATLRAYQVAGLRWLARMTDLGLGGCLADDMGLGKTITLIALHLHRQLDERTRGVTLVVCPASLLGNWEREINRFAPGVPVRRFHGARRDLDDAHSAGGFVLTTYGTMRLDADRLGEHPWALVVADEAQHVKNHLSDTAKALRSIGSLARVALTGTPVENNLSELWAILDWTTPGLLGSLGQFRRRWASTVESGSDPAAAQALSRLLAPFLLRRRKSDPGIAPELPRKTETDHPVALTREQAALYEATVRELMADIGDSTGMRRRGQIVKLLTGLKQICNHPAQYLKESDGRLAGRSGKLELLDELVDSIRATDGAVLVFTQYVAMARLIERHLAGRDIPTQLLHGGIPVAGRQKMVDRFQRGEFPVFLLSLKAAGTGLNLTRADHVVHFDRWWNPAVEDQATDRAYRIGQLRPVQVHRLLTEGTIEDRIAQLLASKRGLADAVLTAGESALTELSDTQLAELVELRRDR